MRQLRIDFGFASLFLLIAIAAIWAWDLPTQALKDAGAIAPVATAFMASLAFVVAIVSIYVQRSLARCKAAVDIFLKTEMDEKAHTLWKDYNAGIAKLKEIQTPMQVWSQNYPIEYEAIRSYLNIHELIAAGIRNEIFDEDLCFEYWGNVLTRACTDARDVIIFARKQPGHEQTYHAVTWLNKRWVARKQKEDLWPPEKP